MKNKFLIYSLAGLLSSVAVTGFADSIQAQSPTASENSQQSRSIQVDQHFIEMMIPHHQDAIAMADLALTRSQRPEVKKMAEAIKKDQTREIQEMRTWYKQWYGKEVPLTSMTAMGMMGNPPKQGSGSPMMNMDKNMMSMMHNMMSEGSPMMSMGKDSMSMGYNMIAMGHSMMSMGQNMMNMGHSMMSMDMEALKTASDFDKEFVRQMVPHHQMAVMMSQMAAGRATRPEIRTLAQSIIKSQNAEIAQMKGWQQAWNR